MARQAPLPRKWRRWQSSVTQRFSDQIADASSQVEAILTPAWVQEITASGLCPIKVAGMSAAEAGTLLEQQRHRIAMGESHVLAVTALREM